MPSYYYPSCPCCSSSSGASGSSSSGPCLGCRMLVAVTNCNGVTDSDFDLYINGTLVAHMPETDQSCQVTRCRGHLVVPTGYTTTPDPAACAPCTLPWLWQTTTHSTLLDDPLCSMVVELKATSNPPCGNYGQLNVYRVCGDGDTSTLQLVYNDSYSGMDNTYHLTGPCCSPSSSSGRSSSPGPSSSSSSSSSRASSSSSSSSGGGGSSSSSSSGGGGGSSSSGGGGGSSSSSSVVPSSSSGGGGSSSSAGSTVYCQVCDGDPTRYFCTPELICNVVGVYSTQLACELACGQLAPSSESAVVVGDGPDAVGMVATPVRYTPRRPVGSRLTHVSPKGCGCKGGQNG